MAKTKKQPTITSYFTSTPASAAMSSSSTQPVSKKAKTGPRLHPLRLHPLLSLSARYALIRTNRRQTRNSSKHCLRINPSVPQTIALPELVIRIQHPNIVRAPCCVDWFHR